MAHAHLEDLLHDVVEDEEREDAFARQHEEVERRDVTQQLHRAEVPRRQCAPGRRKLDDKSISSKNTDTYGIQDIMQYVCGWKHGLDDAEEVDVGVVDGEVDEDDARAAVDPQVLHHLVDDRQRTRLDCRQVLDEAATAVRRDETPVLDAVQLLCCLVDPAATVPTLVF